MGGQGLYCFESSGVYADIFYKVISIKIFLSNIRIVFTK